MAMKYKTLTEMPFDELIRQYDEAAGHTSVGLNYYTEEIARRRTDESNRIMIDTNKSMVRMTRWITIMTAIMLLSTIVSAVISIVK